MHSEYRFSVAAVIVLLALLGLSACDSASLTKGVPSEDFNAEVAEAVQDVSLSPLSGKSGDPEYLLKITFDRSRKRLRFPAGINILGKRQSGSHGVIYDDGKGPDSHADDGIYTGIVDEGCLPAAPGALDGASKGIEIKCKIEFVGPGEQCGAFDECPESMHRSFLWGLIEYDVNTLICFCLAECEVTKK